MFFLAAQWLNRCITRHSYGHSPVNWNPTRLVDLSSKDLPEPYLCEVPENSLSMPYLTVSLLGWIYALYADGRTAESDEDLYSFFGASENTTRRNDYRPMSRLQIHLDRFLMHHP